jgi:hypothetical protein
MRFTEGGQPAWRFADVVCCGPIAGIIGGVMSNNAISSGRDAANAIQLQELQKAEGFTQPYRDVGTKAVGVAGDLSGANGPDAATAAMANYQTSPGYQWQLGQGLRAIDAGAASRGMLRSGATLKGEETYGQGLANQDFSNYYNRLFSLSQLGSQNAATASGQAVTTGQGIASTDTSAAASQASIYANVAKGIGNQTNQLFNAAAAGF